MISHSPQILGFFWGGSEFLLSLVKRSKGNAVSKDRNSLPIIWFVSLSAAALGIAAAYKLPQCRLPWPLQFLELGWGLFAFGTALRWYAIIHLGRFFTTNVAIASDHRVIDTGPYHFIRHPSYTGSMLAVLGFTLTFSNWASVLIIWPACFSITLWRIHIEEEALVGALGESYRSYMQRTKRLVPLIY